jgi:periplasmic protein TonB
MFEDSTFSSGGKIKTKSKYFTLVGFLLNGAVLAALILYPLIYPEALPKAMMTTLLVAPPPPLPPPPPPPPAAPVHVKVVSEMINNQLTAPTKIPHDIKIVKEDAPPPAAGFGVAGMEGSGSGSGVMGGILGGLGSGPAPKVQAAAPKKVAVSSGVMAGNRIGGENPSYPAIAKAARIQGTVVLQATISKNGTIENLRVISGPPMLQSAAMQAVQGWRYKPYLLNGEPVEVETQVNVVFSLGS